VSVAVLTILGMPITFFHLLGLFIVIGLGMDYAIFHINMKKNAELRPVFYSFLTSFIGFGLLAFTSFFLIAAMGMILAIGIAVSYVVSLYLFRN
jgi:predicted exporter